MLDMAASSNPILTLLIVGLPTIGAIILAAYLASRRRPPITRLSEQDLRKKFVRGELTSAEYHTEVARRGSKHRP